ncbi:MAG: DUF1638 domain-containing protein [Planctomycetes bacterium]|nr:DUF1638 domain-containing protein [Planctomycetota bacterium]
MRLNPGEKVMFIGCEILFREACLLAARSPLQVDIAFQHKGLHDLPTAQMRSILQQAIDGAAATGQYRAVLLGYARCNDGVVGLRAPSIPLVIPKGHDCITLFFGSRRKYQDYFDAHPGTYFHTTGWVERNDPDVPGQRGVMEQLGLNVTFGELVAKYGQENARYVLETLGDWKRNYRHLCYIRMGVADEQAFIDASRDQAAAQNWQFDLCDGDLSLLERLLGGLWDDDLLVIPPGGSITARNDAEVLGCDERQE